MDKLQENQRKILLSTLKVFTYVSPFLIILSISRSVNTGWQPLYSIHIALGVLLIATYYFREKIPSSVLTIFFALFFYTIAIASALRNESIGIFGFMTFIAFVFLLIYFQKRNHVLLIIIIWSVSIFIMNFYLSGYFIESLQYAIGATLSAYLPTNLLLDGAKSVNKLNKELTDKNKQQEKLFAIIGHELRTPASALQMLLEKAIKEKKLAEDAQLPLLQTSEHLLTALDDMKVVINPETAIQGKMVNSSVYNIIDDLLISQERLLHENNLQINIEANQTEQTVCFCNAQLIRQISLNLIKNAAIHAKASILAINIHNEAQSNDKFKVKICFADNGKGINKEHQATLFDAFVRGDSEADGSGLGLHLSKKFAQEQLGGDLILDTSYENGARFVLTMLLDKQNTDTDTDTDTELNKPLTGLNILLAEDNDMIRILTEEQLSEQGATVFSGVDGQQALALYQQHQIDIVISDAFMPNIDGFELIKTLRQSGFTNLIVAVTAATVGHERTQLSDAGANEVLSKPFNIPKFLALVEKYSRQQAHQQAQQQAQPEHQPQQNALTEQTTASPEPVHNRTAAELFNEPLFNEKRALENFGGHKSMIKPTLKIFIPQHQEVIMALNKSLQQQDAKELKKIAHTFKGSAMTWGSEPLTECCKQLMTLAEQQNYSEIPKAIEKLDATSIALIKALEERYS